MRRKEFRYVLIVMLLVIVDIVIKIMVETLFLNKRFYLCDNLGFVPKLNTQQLSMLNKDFQLGISIDVLIIINIVALVVVPLTLYFEYRKGNLRWYSEAALLLGIAGAFSSLIDKIFWGGSLDYILFFSQIGDLKDVYLYGAVVVICVGYVIDVVCKRRKSIGKIDIHLK